MGSGKSKNPVPLGRPQQNPEKIRRLTNILMLKSEYEQAAAVRNLDKHQNDLHNNEILKGLFKKLDPAVVKPMGNVLGEIQLSFKYDFDSELLLVKVIKCRELGSSDLRAKLANTFVRLELLPDPFNQGERKTIVVQNTNNPRYDEILSFHIAEPGLGDGRLVVHVMDHSLGGRSDIRGEAIINLNSFPFHSNPVHTAWYKLNIETDLNISGTLDVSVAFQIPRTLLVTVYGANDLAPRGSGQSPDPYVRLAVPGCNMVYETKVMENAVNPVWAETFEFPIHEEEFEHRYVTFHVQDKGGRGGDDSLGQCVVELTHLDPAHGLNGTYPLSDMRNSDKMRTKMHQTKTAQEFREALVAHSFIREPNFIFKNHTGKKIVTVTCRQAGSQGRVRLVDGIPMY